MRKLYSFLVNKHQTILRYLLILATVLIITSLFPKTSKFKYDYEKGRPWKHEKLIAPFDFAVKKSEGELLEDRQNVLKDFRPYYRFDKEISEKRKRDFVLAYRRDYNLLKQDSSFIQKMVGLFKSVFQKEPDSLKSLEHGLAILDNVYSNGVIDLSEQHEKLPKETYINLLNENIAAKRQIKSLYRIVDAYALIRDTLKNTHHEFMLSILEPMISYNVFYDDSITQKIQAEFIDNISTTRGRPIQEGEEILDKGNLITEYKYQVLESLKQEYERRIVGVKMGYLITAGYFLLTSLSILILVIFLAYFQPELFSSTRKVSFVLLLLLLITYLASLSENLSAKLDFDLYYLIPYCIAPIILRSFFGTQLALFVHLTIVLITGFIVPVGFEFQFTQFVAGMIAIFTNINARYWSQFFISILLILLTYSLSYLGASLIQEGDFKNIEWLNFGMIGLNGVFILLAYPLIPLSEKIFGFVSELTLAELGDSNKPLLKELQLKAPGTFQHSLQVANLAEGAAYEIGANTLMVRVGSLYHDIGKMEQPLYFVENQISEVNPHDDLAFEESAKIIIDHVKKGVEIAKKHSLPDLLIDFIRTHHGTSRVEYFYQSYLKNFPASDVEEESFTYPGPKPYSRETAIVMIADSAEAASRSIKNHTAEDIDKLVDNIIQQKIDQEQLVNSDITFKDITTISKVLKKMLKSIYHARVMYPEQKLKKGPSGKFADDVVQ